MRRRTIAWIVLATGQPGLAYDSFSREHQKRFRAQGLRVELVNTAGSVDNFRRIIDGKVDVAFAQSGTYQVVADPEHKVDDRRVAEAAVVQALLRPAAQVEDKLATARWPDELREGINELEALRGEVPTVSGRLPLQQQQDVYHWRLHVSLILNEAVERLNRMEAQQPR